MACAAQAVTDQEDYALHTVWKVLPIKKIVLVLVLVNVFVNNIHVAVVRIGEQELKKFSYQTGRVNTTLNKMLSGSKSHNALYFKLQMTS